MLSQSLTDRLKVSLVFILAPSTKSIITGNGLFSQIWSHMTHMTIMREGEREGGREGEREGGRESK